MNMWILFSILLVRLILLPDPLYAKKSHATPSTRGHQAEQVITLDQFRIAMVQEFEKRYSLQDVDLMVKILSPKKPVTVKQGQLNIQVTGDPMGVRTGRRAFRLGLYVDSQLVKNVNIVADVNAQADVFTPVRWIKPHEILQSEDLLSVNIKLPSLGHDFVQHPTHAVGKKAIRPLPPNQPLRQSFLAVPPVIHKGDRVMIEARQGGLVVQTVGTAKAPGKPGEMILVKNLASGRDVLGKVLGSGVVEVQF